LLAPDEGEVIWHPQVRLGILDQEGMSLLPKHTLLEAYQEGLPPGPQQQHVGVLLASGLFRYEELSRPVGVLSAGQRRKTQIARMMATAPNVLLLDEPTNHISFDVLERFEDALAAYKGTVIAISHDRRFLSRFSGEIWELRNGNLQM
jgi:macrolide transport system ATP-binding/permease protein